MQKIKRIYQFSAIWMYFTEECGLMNNFKERAAIAVSVCRQEICGVYSVSYSSRKWMCKTGMSAA